MDIANDERFRVAQNAGLKPHGHGIPETLWIEDRWGQCHPIEEIDKVLADHLYTDSLEGAK